MMKNQTVRVSKRFSFDMAHALFGYDGPCKNIHGHTYHLTVTLSGKPIIDTSNVKLGMVIDFSELKKIVQVYIHQIYDHALVINENAPYAQSELIANEFEKVYKVPYQPTCENLLLHFVSIIQEHLPSHIQLVTARLEETPSSYAEWHASDNE
ncbi:MAG: 6-carboxytetrahydropterin synthase [Chitinophagales bacterium]|nr:6-carboxytetrahydropterin synthase [Chitinophagales bacterium]